MSSNYISLKELVNSANTGADAIKRAPIVEEDTGLRCIRIGDISNNRPFNEWGFTRAEDKVINKFLLKKDDILVARTGNTIGVVKYIDKDLKSLYNNGLIRLKVTQNICPKYVYYNLISKNFKQYIYGISAGTSTQPNIKINHMLDYKVMDIPYNEQKAIVDILSSLDDKIELNNQMNKTLEEMAQALFKRWFVDFEFPNEEGQPYKSSGGEMVESEVRMIPKGWDIATLDNICSLMTKSVKPFENPEVLYEHFSLPACDEGKLPVMEFGNQISSNKYMINNSCILISKLNPATKRIWDPVCKENSICSTEFMVYQPKNSGIKPFCYELINSDRFTEYLLCNVTGSTGSRQRVQPKLTLKYPFVISNSYLVEEFSSLVKPMHDKIKVNIEENRILKKTRDTLLPKLMSGEIRVSDLKS